MALPVSVPVRPLVIGVLVLLLLPLAVPLYGSEPPRLTLVLDASGSMWGRVGGEPKIVAARQVLSDLADELPETSEVGLVAYGHRREGDCEDIEVLLPLGPLDRGELTRAVAGLNPKGKTPITEAMRRAVSAAGAGATILLVSDGLETCSGDPCELVRQARSADARLTVHVIGFDVGDVDVSQLTCMAEVGGGRYFGASDAVDLAAALDQVVVESSGPTGGLRVGAFVGEEPVDALVVARDATSGKDVGRGRTYSGAETNPLLLALPPATYDVEVEPVRISGARPVSFSGVVIEEGTQAERTARFGRGTVEVTVRRNGELSDAVVRVIPVGEATPAAQGRTYGSAQSNPKSFTVPPGDYEVEIESVEISGASPHRRPVTVKADETVEVGEDFASGTARVRVTAGRDLADAVVSLTPDGGASPVAQGRTYTSETSNPKSFVVEPGRYRVEIRPIRDGSPRELTLDLEAGGEVEQTVDVGS